MGAHSLVCLVMDSGEHIMKQPNARNGGTFVPHVILEGTFTLCCQYCSKLQAQAVTEWGEEGGMLC
jgi:hypothetical protein